MLKTIWHELGHTILGLQHTCENGPENGHIMFSPDTAHYEVPPKKAPGGGYYYYLDDTYQWHEAVRDMMTGNKQIPYDCGSARGNKTFTCYNE